MEMARELMRLSYLPLLSLLFFIFSFGINVGERGVDGIHLECSIYNFAFFDVFHVELHNRKNKCRFSHFTSTLLLIIIT